MYIQGLVYTYISLLLSAERSDTPLAVYIPTLRPWFLISFSSKRNQGFLEKWLILGLGQEIHTVSLQYFVMPESKELQKQKQKLKLSKVCKMNIGAN